MLQRRLSAAKYWRPLLRAGLPFPYKRRKRIEAAAKVMVSLVVLISLAAAQQSGRDASQAPRKPRHVYTNEDLSRSDEELPPAPGLVKCGQDLRCFLRALDKGTPAAVTRTEITREGTAVVTSNSTWWTTQFAADRCTVEFRVDAIDASVNEEVVPQAAHHAVEDKLAEMKRDFESVRGKTETCSLTVKDLKSLMTSSSWSLMSVGPASNFGKNCSGPGFDSPRAPLESDKK